MRDASAHLGQSLDTPAALFEYLIPLVKTSRRDEFHVLCLDKHGRLLLHVHFPWLNQSEDAFRRVVMIVTSESDATSIVLAQGHAGRGRSPKPNIVERTLRKELTRAMHAMGVQLRDHVVVGGRRLWSFRAYRSFLIEPPASSARERGNHTRLNHEGPWPSTSISTRDVRSVGRSGSSH